MEVILNLLHLNHDLHLLGTVPDILVKCPVVWPNETRYAIILTDGFLLQYCTATGINMRLSSVCMVFEFFS